MDFREFFKHPVCVTLERRSDRWRDFIRQFEDPFYANWKPEKVLGVDGKAVGAPDWFLWGKKKKAREGAFGCHESHVGIFKRALEEGWENVLIFEDDCVLKDNFRDQLNRALSELPEDWDFFYLGGQNVERHIQEPFQFSPNLLYNYNVNRTHSFAINRKALPLVVEYTSDHTHGDHIDWQLGRIHKRRDINCYSTNPWVTYQAAGESDIVEDLKGNLEWPPAFVFQPVSYGGIKICFARTGYGRLGLGKHTYDPREIGNNLPGYLPISLHSPSRLYIQSDVPLLIYGGLDGNVEAKAEQIFLVNETEAGRIKHQWDKTVPVKVSMGYNSVEFFSNGVNSNAHTVVYFKKED